MHPEVEKADYFSYFTFPYPKKIDCQRAPSFYFLYVFSEENGEHSATARYLLADVINNCSNCYVEARTDCYDSLT